MEQQLNIFFSNRPIQLLDIPRSDKESIRNIDIRQFIEDYFTNARKHINITKRDEVIHSHKKSSYYKKLGSDLYLSCIYQYTEEKMGLMGFQRYNLITEEGDPETDYKMNKIANSLYKNAVDIFQHITKNNTITDYKEECVIQGVINGICNKIYEYLVELTKLTLKENNEHYIDHVKYEYQKAVQLFYYFMNIEFYNQSRMQQTAVKMKNLLLFKWETNWFFTIEKHYPKILEYIVTEETEQFEEVLRQDYKNDIDNLVEKIFMIQHDLGIDKRKNNEHWFEQQDELTQYKTDEVSKILAIDYVKILRKRDVYKMHQKLQNIVQEQLQHEYNTQVEQQAQHFERELGLIREQEQKEQEQRDQQRKQVLKQEAQYFANNYK